MIKDTLYVCLQRRNYSTATYNFLTIFNPSKPELNPICYLLALLGAHHFLHVSRIRIKLLSLR
jgi:transposase